MSWSIALSKPVPKAQFNQAIDDLPAPEYCEAAAVDQIQTAKDAAKLIARTMPGPYLSASMSGHANGVGWQAKDGFCDDTIGVYVNQVTSPPSE